MVKPKIEGLGGDNRLKVDVPVDSDPYKTFLEAQRERERLREENGGDTIEGVELVRKAVAGVNLAALEQFRKEKSN
jgi:hypothetical protein